jgi:RNA polymerase sigma-70 factor (ECF subfamily)
MVVAWRPTIGLWRRNAGRWCGWGLALARERQPAVMRQFASQAPDGIPSSPAQPQTGALTAEYERFVRQHERQVLNYLWRMTGDEHAAYDLTQEVFLRAWQRFDALRSYEQPRSWLFRVATNLALTHLKRRSRQGESLSLLEEDHEPAGGDPAWRLAESDLVRRTLLRLSPRRRAALVLREVYQLTSDEVGHALGMSTAAVRMALHRGREQFRELYRQEGGTDGDA